MLNVQYTDEAVKDLRRIGHVAAGKVRDKVSEYARQPCNLGQSGKEA